MIKQGVPSLQAYCKACKVLEKIKTRYGLSQEQYLKMHQEQEHKCAICNKKTKLCVDHCHATKKIRALLCHQCNVLLGAAKDDLKILKKAIKYLQYHQAQAQD